MEADEKLAMLSIIYGDVVNVDSSSGTIYRIKSSDNSIGLVDIYNDTIIEPIYASHRMVGKVLENNNEGIINTVHLLVTNRQIGHNQLKFNILNKAGATAQKERTRKVTLYNETRHSEIYSIEEVELEVAEDNGTIVIMPGNYNQPFGDCIVYDTAYDSIISVKEVMCLTTRELKPEFRGDVVLFNKDKTKVNVFHHGKLISMLERLSIMYREVIETNYGYKVLAHSRSRVYTDLNKIGTPMIVK